MTEGLPWEGWPPPETGLRSRTIMPRICMVIIALFAGLIFFSGSTAALATASNPAASKKQNSKNLHSKKKKG